MIFLRRQGIPTRGYDERSAYLSQEISAILAMEFWTTDASAESLPSGIRVEIIPVGDKFQWKITWPSSIQIDPYVSVEPFPLQEKAKDAMKAELVKIQGPIHHQVGEPKMDFS